MRSPLSLLLSLLVLLDALGSTHADTPAASPAPPRKVFTAIQPALSPMAGAPYKPTAAEQAALDAARDRNAALLTLSPTPLYSTFSAVDPAFETEAAPEGATYMPNVALNASCVLSSSVSSAGTFCRITEDGQTLATASEDAPFVVVDLERLYYVDHISFGVNVDAESARSKILIWCSQESHVDMTRATVDGLPRSWSKELLHDTASLALHVHAPCSYVRIQRKSFGALRVHDLRVFGAVARKSPCASDDGLVCGGHGSCAGGACECESGFAGALCERRALPSLAVSTLQALALVAAFVAITLRCRTAAAAEGSENDDDDDCKEPAKLASAPPPVAMRAMSTGSSSGSGSVAVPPAPQQLCPVRASSIFDDDCNVSSSLLPSLSSLSRSTSALSSTSEERGDLHILFASPLVMTDSSGCGGSVRPVQGLDINREYLLLRRSLRTAAAVDQEIPVSVSCGTVERLHTLLTLGSARCLHFSGHCTKDFIALEDAAGALHRVHMDALRGLLRATVTARSCGTLRLVVLNACSSEAAGREFVLAGVSHVIAYRKRIRDASAATFTRAFYLALACGRTVQDAFESAKEAVSSSPSASAEELDAFVLMPERASHAEVIWRRDAGLQRPPSARWPESSGMPALPALCEDFVGRHAATWQILRHLMVDRRRVVTVHGAAGSGKTQLALAVAHHLHERRSVGVMRDGVLWVRAGSRMGAGTCEDDDEQQLAQLVDALWDAVTPMMALCEEEQQESSARLQLNRTKSAPPVDAPERAHDDEEDARRCDRSASLASTRDSLAACLAAAASAEHAVPAGQRALTRARALTQLLEARSARCLLVLDGVRESPALAETLARLLDRCAGVRVLMTSRTAFVRGDALSVNVVNQLVPPLQAGDAALLLVRHLKRKLVHGGGTKEVTLQELAECEGLRAKQGNPRAIIQAALALAADAQVGEPVSVERL